jgi:hypothetical protein
MRAFFCSAVACRAETAARPEAAEAGDAVATEITIQQASSTATISRGVLLVPLTYLLGAAGLPFSR